MSTLGSSGGGGSAVRDGYSSGLPSYLSSFGKGIGNLSVDTSISDGDPGVPAGPSPGPLLSRFVTEVIDSPDSVGASAYNLPLNMRSHYRDPPGPPGNISRGQGVGGTGGSDGSLGGAR